MQSTTGRRSQCPPNEQSVQLRIPIAARWLHCSAPEGLVQSCLAGQWPATLVLGILQGNNSRIRGTRSREYARTSLDSRLTGAHSSSELELAGHADLSTTQRYMHLSPAATEDAIRLLDGRLGHLKVAPKVAT
jgi:hypothetical protein